MQDYVREVRIEQFPRSKSEHIFGSESQTKDTFVVERVEILTGLSFSTLLLVPKGKFQTTVFCFRRTG
jgi:hypothetical protein